VADQMLRWSDAELEAALRSLGGRVVYPPTPDLAESARARLAQAAALMSPRGRVVALWPRVLAAVLVAALLVAGAALAMSPAAREAVAQRLGLRGVAITHVGELPTPTVEPTRTATSTPAPPGAALNLGTLSALADARARVSFGLLVPSALGDPDAAYFVNPREVSLVYAPRATLPRAPQSASVGLLLTEFHATLDETLFQKGIPPNARLEEVRVGASRGFFISGAPHSFFYRDASGTVRQDRSRLAGNTLLWEQNGLTLRLESALDRDESIRIAESLR
jgi:hypothetical protein